MRPRTYLSILSPLLGLFISLGAPPTPAVATVDFGIGFDKKTDRPSLFIAWRNTERILEVELEIKNYGDEQGTGRLAVSILDEDGIVLESSSGPVGQPITVTLPPFASGGKEGKIVQMHGSKSLNLLIDRLDRANSPYMLKAEIFTDQNESNLLNNAAVKTFNINSRARPGCVHFRDYYFRNSTDKPIELLWKVETSPVPKGWEFDTEPSNGKVIRVEPGALVQGHATVRTSKALDQGDHIDVRFTAIDKSRRSVFGQFEWFLVYDTTPPEITGLAYSVEKETGLVEVTLTANDVVSFIKEASGVRVEYSTDKKVTFSNRVLAYLDGNFIGPTRFRGELGPFAPGTLLAMSVIVEDAAGNAAQRDFELIEIGHRAPQIKASTGGGGL